MEPDETGMSRHPLDSLALDWSDIDVPLSDLVDPETPHSGANGAYDLLRFDLGHVTEEFGEAPKPAQGHGVSSTMQQLPHGAAPQQSPRMSRKALLKEKNRQAQARYRQRKLQEVKEVEEKIVATQQRLNVARARLASGRAFSRELAERCKAITAAMLTLTDPHATSRVPPIPTSSSHPPLTPPPPAPPPAPLAPPPAAPAPSAYDLSAQVQRTTQPSTAPAATQPPPAPPSPPAPQRSPPSPPAPPETLTDQERISNSPLLPLMPLQPPLPRSSVPAALDPSATFSHLSGPKPPLAGGPMLLSLQLFSAATALGAPSWAGGPAQALPAAEALVGQLGDELRRRRAAAAAAAGVDPARIAWYLQAPYTTPAGDRVSFSTAIASPPCLASKFVFLVASCLESTFLSAAIERTSVREGQAVDAPGDSHTQAPAGPSQPGSGASSTRSAAATRATDASAAARDTIARMTAVVKHYPLCSDGLQGSCGVGSHFRVASGAAAIVERMCQRYRRLLPRAVWIETCAAFAQLMLRQRSNSAPWLPCSIHGIYGARSAAGDGASAAAAAADGGGSGIASGTGSASTQERVPRDPRRAGDYPSAPNAAQRDTADRSGDGACSGVARAGEYEPPPHDASLCPRCGVLSCIAEVMRKVLQEVVKDASAASDARAQVDLDAAAAAGELRSRAQELYSAYAVFLSQCCTDAPHLTRHIKLNSTSSDPQQKVAHEMNMKLFRQLRLPPRQLQLAAAAAEFWRRRRKALDADLAHALAPLSTLPTLSSLPPTTIFTLCDLRLPAATAVASDTDEGPPDVPAPLTNFSSSLTLSADSGVSARTARTARTAHSAAREDAQAGVRLDLDAEVEQGVCAVCAVYGCSHRECEQCQCERTGVAAAAWQKRLLGCDPAAAAAARASLRRLREFQDADSRLFADMQRAVRMPGCLFTADQMVGGLPTALQYAVPFVDWLRVCQTAAGEARAAALRTDADTMGWAI